LASFNGICVFRFNSVDQSLVRKIDLAGKEGYKRASYFGVGRDWYFSSDIVLRNTGISPSQNLNLFYPDSLPFNVLDTYLVLSDPGK
jgi:hypothetical protein